MSRNLSSSAAGVHARRRRQPQQLQPKADRARIRAAYAVLQLEPGCTQAQIRAAYLAKARQLHPDTASVGQNGLNGLNGSDLNGASADAGAEASGEAALRLSLRVEQLGAEFVRIQDAYAYLSSLHADILSSSNNGATEAHSDSASSSSSHPVPNAAHANTITHRSYLRNEGVGSGMDPAKRDRQYRTHRLERGLEGVLEYKTAKLNREWEQAVGEAETSKSTAVSSFDSLLALTRAGGQKHINQAVLLEEQIKAAMQHWDARQFKDFGKPLSHLDDSTHLGSMDPLERKLHHILQQNGVLPDWVRLEREISSEYNAGVGEARWVWNELVSVKEWEEGRKKIAAKAEQDCESSASLSSASSTTLALYPSLRAPVPKFRSPYGPCWSLALTQLHALLRRLNARVDDYNVSLPAALAASKQRVHFEWASLVADIESQPPQRESERGKWKPRERALSPFSRSRRKNMLLSNARLATQLGGDAEEDDVALRANVLNGASAAESERHPNVNMEEWTDSDAEDMYRSLSSIPLSAQLRLPAQESDGAPVSAASRHPTHLSAGLLFGIAASLGAVFAFPLWLHRRQKQRQQKELHERLSPVDTAASLLAAPVQLPANPTLGNPGAGTLTGA